MNVKRDVKNLRNLQGICDVLAVPYEGGKNLKVP
ncbi:hypothetical protein BASH2_04635 [Bacillus anthracis]|nr:hypothetical protein BASH2_04635 [Bacillus anthracis]